MTPSYTEHMATEDDFVVQPGLCIIEEPIGCDASGNEVVLANTNCHGHLKLYRCHRAARFLLVTLPYYFIMSLLLLMLGLTFCILWCVGLVLYFVWIFYVLLGLLVGFLCSSWYPDLKDILLDSLLDWIERCGHGTYRHQILPGGEQKYKRQKRLQKRRTPAEMTKSNNPSSDHVDGEQAFLRHNNVTSMHQPSATFRLLMLLPGARNEPLYCNMIESSVPAFEDEVGTAPHPYSAISYSWEGVFPGLVPKAKSWLRRLLAWLRWLDNEHTPKYGIPKECAIEVNGETFFITQTLGAALRSIRDPEIIQTVWCDQVCIDQSDPSEKQRQVALMPRIYKHAEKVIVWIDIGKNDIGAVEEVVSLFDSWAHSWLSSPSSSEQGLSAKAYDIWQRLASSRWWTRIWVIQEVAHATAIEIRTDRACFPSQHVEAILTRLWKDQQLAVPDLTRKFVGFVTSRSGSSLSILSLLEEFRHSQASLPQDRLFALVGLAYDGQKLCAVDYEASHLRTCSDMAVNAINEYKSLAHLVSTEGNSASAHHQGHNMSWSPLWEAGSTITRTPIWRESSKSSERHANRPRGRRIALYSSERFLSVRFCEAHYLALNGYVVGRVMSRGAQFVNDQSLRQKRKILRSWQLEVSQQQLADDATRKRQEMLQIILPQTDTTPYEHDWRGTLDPSLNDSQLDDRCSGRRLLLLDDGTPALGHSNAEEDDIVVRLFGAEIAYVVRQTRHTGPGFLHSSPRRCAFGCLTMLHSSCCMKETYIIIGQVVLNKPLLNEHEAQNCREFIFE